VLLREVAVVAGAGFGVGQRLVGVVDLGEALCADGVAGVEIRVEATGQRAVGGLEAVGVGVGGEAEHLVEGGCPGATAQPSGEARRETEPPCHRAVTTGHLHSDAHPGLRGWRARTCRHRSIRARA
jgi:hypothetical protein